MDYSKLSNEDLLALKSGDYSKMSNEGLMVLKEQPTQQPQQEAPTDIMGAVKGAAQAAMPAPMQMVGQLSGKSPDAQRGIMTGMASLAPGMTGAALAPVAGAAVDIANSPQARNVIQQGVQEVAKGNLANAGVRAIDAIQDNPEAVKEFGKKRAVEAGAGLAGLGIAKGAKAVSGAIKSIGSGGPFTMALENPSLVKGSVREKILKELAKSEQAAMGAEVKEAGELAREASRLVKWSQMPAGRRKLADEAVQALKSGKDISNQALLAYDKALGDVASDGQFGSKIYMEARDGVLNLLKKQAPSVSKNKSAALEVFMSEGKAYGKNTDQFGKLSGRLPFVGPLTRSTVASPFIRRAAGAATRGAFESARPLSQAVAAGYNSGKPELNIAQEMDKAFKKRKRK